MCLTIYSEREENIYILYIVRAIYVRYMYVYVFTVYIFPKLPMFFMSLADLFAYMYVHVEPKGTVLPD
jgi:hypothetical protein